MNEPGFAGVFRTCLHTNHADYAEWLLNERGIVLSAAISDSLDEEATLEALKNIQASGTPVETEALLISATARGYLTVIEWLNATRASHGTSDSPSNKLLRRCHYIHEHFLQYKLSEYEWAGDLLSLKRLHANGLNTPELLDLARHGHLHVIKAFWSELQNDDIASAMAQAAMNGHMDVVMWLHANRHEGCTACLLILMLRGVNKRGHIDVRNHAGDIIRWLRAHSSKNPSCRNNCHYQIVHHYTVVSRLAVRYGNLAFLQDLLEHHIDIYRPKIEDFRQDAVSIGHQGIVQWLTENYPNTTG